MHLNWAVFLDRDGTIIYEKNYLSNVTDLALLPHAAAAIKSLNSLSVPVIIITNQSGLSRGYFSLQTLTDIHDALGQHLQNHGAHFDDIYYCPHHPDDGCSCRKPATGMLEQSAKDYNLDLSSSFMIGDQLSDIEAGKRAGCRTILVLTGYGQNLVNRVNRKQLNVDYIAGDLNDAVAWLLVESQQPNRKNEKSND